MNGRFEQAAIAIFVAMVLDGMDGRVARWTNTQSEFGAEYRHRPTWWRSARRRRWSPTPGRCRTFAAVHGSLLGWLSTKLGWIAAFIYCAGAAIRLARFNANIDVVDKRYFQGLPSPAAAVLRRRNRLGARTTDLRGETCGGSLGPSRCSPAHDGEQFPFYSGKDINLRAACPFRSSWASRSGLVFLMALASTLPEILFLLFGGYALSGYVLELVPWPEASPPQ